MQPGIKLVPKNKLPPNTEVFSKHIAEGGPTMYARRKTADFPAYKLGGATITVLYDDSGSTPASLSVAAQTLVGRITGGTITGLTAAQVNTLLGGGDTEIFIPIYYSSVAMNRYGSSILAAGNTGSAKILVPQDFVSIVALEIILVPQTTKAAMHATIRTRYGAYGGGESFEAHGEVETDRNMGATVSFQNKAHGISDLVDAAGAALVAGDLLEVDVTYSATVDVSDFYFGGLRLKYS